MERFIGQVVDVASSVLPALLGGLVDYINQIQRKKKKWSFIGFCSHILSAIFFGWITGTVAGGLGYPPDIVAASGGMGGYLGVRLADLITYQLTNFKRK